VGTSVRAFSYLKIAAQDPPPPEEGWQGRQHICGYTLYISVFIYKYMYIYAYV
jgi:hypothetical protein